MVILRNIFSVCPFLEINLGALTGVKELRRLSPEEEEFVKNKQQQFQDSMARNADQLKKRLTDAFGRTN